MSDPSARLLTLLSLLQARRDWPGEALADRLAVSTRTVRRDVDRLRALGYRVDAVKGPDGGYRLEAGSELPPLRFDDDQAVAVAIALRSAPTTGADIDEAAERALATVRQVLPSRLRHRVDGVRFAAAAPAERADPAVLAAVSEAVRRQRGLRFSYGDLDAPARHAEPHGLVARGGRWYLVAWDVDQDDWRIFRVDRLVPRTPGGGPFVPRPVPTGDVVTFVAARAKGATDEDAWPCRGRFVVDLPASDVAPWVREGAVEALTERSTLVSSGSWSWAGLLADALRFDAPFRVVGPDAFAAAAGALAARLARATSAGDAWKKTPPDGAASPVSPAPGRVDA
ncbi:helix-turn-helix transcriptional regulator [Luteimicrobium sp. NPDC057192]|uniref:helix-turn-helix transcriptional regulator n=1 Tax=Luteimicrobium sp. NPDC057192 TaxID=3346042 RepID=UPI00363E7491